MKKTNNRSELVPVAQTLAEGFEDLFNTNTNPVDEPGVWAEPQLYLLPICVPQDRHSERFRSIKISETIKVRDQIKHRSFRVNPDPELGLPGSFELEVMTGLYRLADAQATQLGSVPEFIDLGTFRSFLSLIGKPCTGKYVHMLKEALKRLMCTICVSEGFFYSKPRDLYIVESFTFISSIEFAGEEDFNGTRYEKNRIKLHEFIRENLQANFRTLIDFEYLRQLRTDIAKPLSLHLAYRLFKSKGSEWTADYSWLAERMAIKVYEDIKSARKQFRPALEELKTTGFIDSWEWIGKRLRFVAGPRLVQMHQRRVQAKDAWLTHQQEAVRVEQLVIAHPPRTQMESARQEAFDPLAGICTRFAAYGWKAVSTDATTRGLTREFLLSESVKRGHTINEPLD